MTDLPAVHFEGIKYSFRQSKDGIIISFVVHPHEVPASLSTSNIGARYMVALVEIDDNEEPKKPEPVKAKKERAPKEKAEWRELTPTAQAILRCKDVPFRTFLSEKHGYQLAPISEEDAAIAVRAICFVRSRSELSTNHKARVIWHGLDSEFTAWKSL